MNTKLYVGNLSHLTTSEDLRLLFAKAGSVVSVEVVKDRDGKPKGFAFVEMVSQSDAGKAVSEFNGYMLDRRKIGVMPARNQGQKQYQGQKSHNKGTYTEYKSYQDIGTFTEYKSYQDIGNRRY